MLNQDNLNELITQALAMEEVEAKEAGALGYMARVLVQATMPHSDPHTCSFKRTNGKLSLAITGHPDIGLPYGVYPRLLLAWLVTEAVCTKSPTLVLGSSLNQFMSHLDLIPTGGRWGTITRLKDQMRRLFSAAILCYYDSEGVANGIGFNIAKEYHLWWSAKDPRQTTLWESTVVLGQDFFNEITERPIPVDIRAIKALKTSSMALDLYCWLTYRLSYLKRKTEIPWCLLQNQFGSDYASTKQGRYEFKRKLLVQLKKVLTVYTEAAMVDEGENGLILIQSPSHIKRIK